jgi:molybdopterin-binding protein
MEDRMKYGARNNVVGKVEEVKKGSVMSQVKVRVDGPIDITSVMTLDTLAELGVKKGDSVRVLVKAVNVILVRE